MISPTRWREERLRLLHYRIQLAAARGESRLAKVLTSLYWRIALRSEHD